MFGKIVDKIKSPIIKRELLKTINEVDTKSLALVVNKLLDAQLLPNDKKEVQQEIGKLLMRLKEEIEK